MGTVFSEQRLNDYETAIQKKVLPYEEWVTRTLGTTDAREKVSNFIFEAGKDTQKYYQVKIQDNQIKSFAVDEWMVMCKKE